MSRAGDGPRLAAMCDAATVYFQDLEHEERWPFYAQAAAAGGVRSVLVVPVPLDDYTRAALTFYSALSCAFARHPMSSSPGPRSGGPTPGAIGREGRWVLQ
jgi:hypothetical protein